ncbi:hypothetical protein [Actinacidiphila acidipaludis]|uniref:Uncharacterized protein n=1 Tax=Actinacidiphila acidipaludis TaxID=2873382 RepID=A0ABS7QFC3_9ACTN|nr:hypothetical protein [Streptomyces acidipaludis]MBY8881861.1 hypothetical protein [Streptomyces acidipaludis]
MKTTMMIRQIANPRRTTLAHLKDVSELGAGEAAAEIRSGLGTDTGVLPQRTANPRRTVLSKLPQAPVAS